MQKQSTIILLILLLGFSCTNNNGGKELQSINNIQKIFRTKGEVVNCDTFPPPRVVEMKVVSAPAGEPDSMILKVPYETFDGFKIKTAGKPIVKVFGTTELPYPASDTIIGVKIIAGKPRIMKVGDPTSERIHTKVFNAYHQGSGFAIVPHYSDFNEDKDGNLWGACSDGIFKFDGQNLSLFNAQQNLSVYSAKILFDHNDDLWVAAGKTITHKQGKYFIEYPIDPDILLAQNGAFSFFTDEQGIIWYMTNKGLYRIDPFLKTKTHFGKELGISPTTGTNGNALLDANGNIWINATDKVHILQFTNELRTNYQLITYSKKEDLFLTDDSSELNTFESSKKGIWLHGSKDGLLKVIREDSSDYTNIQFIKLEATKTITNQAQLIEKEDNMMTDMFSSVSCMEEDRNGTIYAKSWYGHFFQLELGGLSAKTLVYKSEEEYLGGAITSMYKDRKGIIWIAGSPNKLIRMSDNPFQGGNQSLVHIPSFVDAVIDNWNRMWFVSTGGQLCQYNPPKEKGGKPVLKYFDTKNGLTKNNVSLSKDDAGNLWIGRSNGLVRMELSEDINDCTFHSYLPENGFPNGAIQRIIQDPKGDIWCTRINFINEDDKPIAERGIGLIRIRGDEIMTIGTEQGLTPRGESYTFEQDQSGNFWMSCWAMQSLIKLEILEENEKIKFTKFTLEHHNPTPLVRSLAIDRFGDVWVGSISSNGFIRIKDLQDGSYEIRNYTISDGLVANHAFSIVESLDGTVLVGSDVGLTKIIRRSNKNGKIEEQIVKYGPRDGYERVKATKLFQTSDSLIWMVTDARMSHFSTKDILSETDQPKVFINNISLFNEVIAWNYKDGLILNNGIEVKDYFYDSLTTSTFQPVNLSLRHDNNFVSVDFSGVSPGVSHRLRYSYRLIGQDKTWSPETPESKAIFGKLGPGKYTFIVKAKHEEGDWGDPDSFTFEIRPPWWKTWWAYLVYALLFGAAVYFFIRERINRVVAKIKILESVRNKISADLHDDVGTTLTGIAMQAEYLALKKPDDIEKEMEEISAMSRKAMEKMRDIVWAMDSRKDKLVNLVDRMRYFADSRFINSDFEYNFDIKEIPEANFIHPELRQNLYLIFKEAITNILKHSNGDKVSIEFEKKHQSFHLKIHDNGVIESNLKSDGLGLSNIRERVESLLGNVTIDREDGFMVQVEIPNKR